MNSRTQRASNSGPELDHTTRTGRSMRSIDGLDWASIVQMDIDY